MPSAIAVTRSMFNFNRSIMAEGRAWDLAKSFSFAERMAPLLAMISSAIARSAEFFCSVLRLAKPRAALQARHPKSRISCCRLIASFVCECGTPIAWQQTVSQLALPQQSQQSDQAGDR